MEAARALVSGGPSAEDIALAAAFGFTAEDYAQQPVAVWPCCWHAVQLFETMATQWRMGPCGPVGMDYAALPAVMRLTGVPASERRDLFDDLRVMEYAALDAIAEARH